MFLTCKGKADDDSLDNFFPRIPSEIILPLAGLAAGQGTFSLRPFDDLRHRTSLPCVSGDDRSGPRHRARNQLCVIRRPCSARRRRPLSPAAQSTVAFRTARAHLPLEASDSTGGPGASGSFRRVVMVTPAALSRATRSVPNAVAGVSTPTARGSRSRSKARPNAASPMIKDETV